MPMRAPVLVTIPVSHYCEKARWALERAGVPFREEGHLPVFNRLAALRRGAWSSVPLLVTQESLLRGSGAILRWAERHAPAARRLLPDDAEGRAEAERWERLADDELGPATRRLAYSWVLPDRALALRMSSVGVPGFELAFTRLAYAQVRRGMERGLQIDPARQGQARATVDAAFARVGERLRDGRPYLCGGRFSAADLAFAALAAPVVLPPAYGGPLPVPGELPPAARAEVERWRATPAGRHVLRLYETGRR